MIILACTILFIAVLNIELYIDYGSYLKSRDVKHKAKPLKRFAMLLPSMVGFTIASEWEWYFVFLVSLFMIAFAWWLLFDGLYNVIRDFYWWFNGAAEGKKDDSWFDKLLRKIPDSKEALIKIGGLALFLIIYLLSIKY